MKKSGYIFWLAVPFLALVIWTASIEIHYLNMPKVRVAVQGYDPRDLLSGHYLNLQPNWQETDCSQFTDNVCPEAEFQRVYRFYLDEDAAKFLDRRMFSNAQRFELEFSYSKNRQPLIREMYINDLSWKTWLEQNKS